MQLSRRAKTGAALAVLGAAAYSCLPTVAGKLKYRTAPKEEEKKPYLTFDDGPDPIQTPKVLKVLKEYQATACFFCIGHKIKGNEALLKSIVTEGHLIGNHSYSHVQLNMLSSSQACSQV